MKSIILTILVTVLFFGGSYFVGNYWLGTLHDDVPHQIIGSLSGVFLFIVFIIFGYVVIEVYKYFHKKYDK